MCRAMDAGAADAMPYVDATRCRRAITAAAAADESSVVSLLAICTDVPACDSTLLSCVEGVIIPPGARGSFPRSQWSSGSVPECSARGPVIESCCGQLCLS